MKIGLIIWDACRPDHLSCYGYNKKTSPFLDKFAKESLIFLNAYTLGTSTPTSLPKIFSGNKNEKRIVLPIDERKMIFELTQKIPTFLRPKLYSLKRMIENIIGKKDVPLLMRKIRKKFKTIVITANPFYASIKKWFDEVLFPFVPKYAKTISFVDPEPLTKKAIEILEKYENLFLIVHYVQPHFPYVSPYSKIKFFEKSELLKALKNGEIEKIIEAYDANIKWVDKECFPLIKKLMKETAIIIFTSDHGELLGEYNKVTHPDIKDEQFKSWDFFCEELMHVPLIIHNKKDKGIDERKIYLHDLLKFIFADFL